MRTRSISRKEQTDSCKTNGEVENIFVPNLGYVKIPSRNTKEEILEIIEKYIDQPDILKDFLEIDSSGLKRHPLENIECCPCGGGQSCIVDRRAVGDWVYEDDIFRKHHLPVRKNCYEALDKTREKVLKKNIPGFC